MHFKCAYLLETQVSQARWSIHASLAVTQEAKAQGSHIVSSSQDTLASRPGTTAQLSENMRLLTVVSQHCKKENIDAPRVFYFCEHQCISKARRYVGIKVRLM